VNKAEKCMVVCPISYVNWAGVQVGTSGVFSEQFLTF
jgi:hypothetical protein